MKLWNKCSLDIFNKESPGTIGIWIYRETKQDTYLDQESIPGPSLLRYSQFLDKCQRPKTLISYQIVKIRINDTLGPVELSLPFYLDNSNETINIISQLHKDFPNRELQVIDLTCYNFTREDIALVFTPLSSIKNWNYLLRRAICLVTLFIEKKDNCPQCSGFQQEERIHFVYEQMYRRTIQKIINVTVANISNNDVASWNFDALCHNLVLYTPYERNTNNNSSCNLVQNKNFWAWLANATNNININKNSTRTSLEFLLQKYNAANSTSIFAGDSELAAEIMNYLLVGALLTAKHLQYLDICANSIGIVRSFQHIAHEIPTNRINNHYLLGLFGILDISSIY